MIRRATEPPLQDTRGGRKEKQASERERGGGAFKAFQLFDRPIELYAWKRISIGTRIGGAERMKEKESKGMEKNIREGSHKSRSRGNAPPVAKIIYRVKNKLATSSSSGVILSSVGILFFFFPFFALEAINLEKFGSIRATGSLD